VVLPMLLTIPLVLYYGVMLVDTFFVVIPVMIIAGVLIVDLDRTVPSGAVPSGTVRGLFLWPIGLGQDCFTGGQCVRDCSALITQQLTPGFRVQARRRFFGRGSGLLWHWTDRRTTERIACWPQAERAAYGGSE